MAASLRSTGASSIGAIEFKPPGRSHRAAPGVLDGGGVQRLWRRRQCLPATDQIGRLLGNHDDRRVDVAADKIRLQASRKTTAQHLFGLASAQTLNAIDPGTTG